LIPAPATAVKTSTAALVRKIAGWIAAVLVVLFIVFVVAEQAEVSRLGAIAACESNKDLPNCMRQRGYLASAPYYPDLTRRMLGSYARLAGNAFGASYKQIEPKKLEEGEEEEAKAEPAEKASAKATGKSAK
jgi:hypothetical protein